MNDSIDYNIEDIIPESALLLLDKNNKELKDAIDIIFSDTKLTEKEKQFFILNSWSILYREKPPTPEEFITSQEWIGDSKDSVFPHIKEIFVEFFKVDNEYRYLYLSTVIGFGKSFLTSLILLYILININLMKDAKKYFNIDPSSMIVCAVASFTIAKAKQSLSSTMLRIMRGSPRFRQVKFEDRIHTVQEEEDKKGSGKIVYCKASSSDTLFQFSGDLHVIAVSDSNSLLGLNLICAAVTELAFFSLSGRSDEDSMNLIQEIKGRIKSRFGNHFLGRLICDSSPFSVKNKLDRQIFLTGEIEADPKNYVIKNIKHWEVHKSKYPLFYEENKFVEIFRGRDGQPSIEIEGDKDREKYKPEEIIKLPMDIYDLYKENPIKVVRDYIGFPSGISGGLIEDYSKIEGIFDNRLKNIVDSITAPESLNPEHLIWDKIKDIFFTKIQDRYEFYRNPNEFRWMAIDQSLSGDVTGISMLHPEFNGKGEIIIVVDFTLTIVPTKEKINLDAIIEFILDLQKLGNIYLKEVTFDQFQSANGIQKLKRYNVNVQRLSVDSDKGAYYTMISYLKTNRLKSGRNIFFKNNLKSLIEVPYARKEGTKVDHTKGKLTYIYQNDWISSSCGLNAKDITDAVSGALYQCVNNIKNYVPLYTYIEEEKASDTVNRVLRDLKLTQGLIIKKT